MITPAERAPRPAPRTSRLVLFDIDGTLLWTDGAGRRAIHRALIEIFGETGPADHRFDGKTDPQIVRELMRVVGHEDEHIDARMQDLFARYVECLREELRDPEHRALPLPGVSDLLTALKARHDIALGLLTGNLMEGARAKLEAVGIDPDMFVIGAFGSDHEHRPELPAIAQRRAREVLGIDVLGRDVVVIGDTPADVECGRDIGARAIGVATGRYSTEELASHGAAAVFRDLTNTAAVVSAITDDR
ncbi:MAG TPA: HAD family hydrolase [Gemmatimonadaceae bacterium]|nr:HAD family hydrolase [Gemmatimonadaceae bacterium]